MSLYAELRRRNVFKVALVYAAVAWLLLQVSDTLGPALHLPDWFVSAVAYLVILGFPVAIIFAWAFELTPEGLRSETKPDSASPLTTISSNKWNHLVIGALVLSLGYFVFDKFILNSNHDAAETALVDQVATQQPGESELDEVDRSIAVLPFVNMSSDEEQEYFSDGLAEELLNLLAGVPDLNVAARTSSFSFKGKGLGIQEIATELNVAHLLEGSVRKDGDKIRITAQLIQADNGYHLWSATFDRQIDSVFEVQDEIANAVVDALKITILGGAPTSRVTDPAAYQLFHEGQYLKRQLTTKSLNRAVDAFVQAVEIDPDYGPAWAELADTYLWGGGRDKFTWSERQALADQAAEKAISIDPDYAFAYYVRGVTRIFAHKNYTQGIEDFQRALELDPDDAFLVAAIGKGAIVTGDLDLALRQYQKALAKEPVVPEFHFFLGRVYLAAGHFDEAEATFRRLLDLTSYPGVQIKLCLALLLKGEFEAALAESSTDVTNIAVYHALGNSTKGNEALSNLIEGGDAWRISLAYGYRGEVDKTFEWLDRMLDNGDVHGTFILTEPAFYSVYSDDRWPQFLDRIGMLEFWQKRSTF